MSMKSIPNDTLEIYPLMLTAKYRFFSRLIHVYMLCDVINQCDQNGWNHKVMLRKRRRNNGSLLSLGACESGRRRSGSICDNGIWQKVNWNRKKIMEIDWFKCAQIVDFFLFFFSILGKMLFIKLSTNNTIQCDTIKIECCWRILSYFRIEFWKANGNPFMLVCAFLEIKTFVPAWCTCSIYIWKVILNDMNRFF